MLFSLKKEFKGVSFKGTPLVSYMDFFGLSGKILVYFDLDNNPLLLEETIKLEHQIGFWNNKNFRLIRLVDITPQGIDIEQTISYYFPLLYGTTIELPTQPTQAFLDLCGYIGELRSGYIYIEDYTPISIIPHGEENLKRFYNFLSTDWDSILSGIQIGGNSYYSWPNDIAPSRYSEVIPKEEDMLQPSKCLNDLPLEEETKTYVEQIAYSLEQIKETGQFLLVLPFLNRLLKEKASLVQKELSPIMIDSDYNITFPKYPLVTVVVPALTKAIYVLFYRHPEGIHLSELPHYKQELKRIYLDISLQNNYERITQTIDSIVAPNSKAIYPHLSRIKSALYELFCESIAAHYCIVSNERDTDLKYIPWCKKNLL
jgi:hypothetical protein